MGYYDGNTVTALWNYAQHFAMSDNSYGTVRPVHARRAQPGRRPDTHGSTCGTATAVYGARHRAPSIRATRSRPGTGTVSATATRVRRLLEARRSR